MTVNNIFKIAMLLSAIVWGIVFIIEVFKGVPDREQHLILSLVSLIAFNQEDKKND